MSVKLSYSAASRFKQCPQKYYHSLKYYSKLKAAALPFGSAIEEGVTAAIQTANLEKAFKVFEMYWRNERNSTRFPVYDNPEYEYSKSDFELDLLKLRESDITESFEELGLAENFESWTDAVENLMPLYHAKDEAFLNHEPSVRFIIRAFWLSCLERGKIMLETFAADLLPEIESIVPVGSEPGIQVPITIENADGDRIIGYVDYVLRLKNVDLPVVVDFKTAAMVYSSHDIETSEQLRTYVQVLEQQIGPCNAAYMVLGKKIRFEKVCQPCNQKHSPQSKKCKSCKEPLSKLPYGSSQLLLTQYPPAFLDQVIDDYDNILKSIVNEVNFRNTASCNLYNRPCEFYDVCWKNKNPDNLDHLAKKKGYK